MLHAHGVNGLDFFASSHLLLDMGLDVGGFARVHVLTLGVRDDVDAALGFARCRLGDGAVVHQEVARAGGQVDTGECAGASYLRAPPLAFSDSSVRISKAWR